MIEYVKVLRIDHWLKNIFIFFGHLVALALLPAEVPQNTAAIVLRIFLSLIPACLVASANYVINEILDAPFDRMHPTKRFRPVPSGKVKLSVLWTLMGVLVVVAFVLAALWFNAGYLVALALLLVSGIAYNVEPVRLEGPRLPGCRCRVLQQSCPALARLVCPASIPLLSAPIDCAGVVVFWRIADGRQALCRISLYWRRPA